MSIGNHGSLTELTELLAQRDELVNALLSTGTYVHTLRLALESLWQKSAADANVSLDIAAIARLEDIAAITRLIGEVDVFISAKTLAIRTMAQEAASPEPPETAVLH